MICITHDLHARLIDIMGPNLFCCFSSVRRMQQNVIPVRDNDDIPKITAIDYDRWC